MVRCPNWEKFVIVHCATLDMTDRAYLYQSLKRPEPKIPFTDVHKLMYMSQTDHISKELSKWAHDHPFDAKRIKKNAAKIADSTASCLE